jgi:CRISPR-associated exonuclease Cas4
MSMMDLDHLERVRAFCERAERIDAQGLVFQHAVICARRCWLHLHRASMNEWSDLIRLGAVRHADSHGRDRSTDGLMGLRPDRIDWKQRVVIEEKSSKSHVEAAKDQLAFYVALLTAATGLLWSGRLYLLGAKRHHEAALDSQQMDRLETSLVLLERLKTERRPPKARLLPVCKGCSNSEFCGATR